MIVVERVQTQQFMGHVAVDVALPSTGIVVVTGDNGCLHGETLVYDPVDQSTLPIVERWSRRQPFHVYAMGLYGFVIAAALPPKRYQKTQMMKLQFENGTSIVVTPNHKFWLDSILGWQTAAFVCAQIQAGVDVQLPTILEHDLSIHAQDGLRWSNKVLDSLEYCLPDSHLYDGQLPLDQDIDQVLAPLPDDVLEHTPHGMHKDDFEPLLEYSRPCPQYDHPSRNHSVPWAHRDVEQCHRSIELRQRHDLCSTSIRQRLPQETCPGCTELVPSAYVPLSKVSHASALSPSDGYYYNYTDQCQVLRVVSVEPVDASHYYDFHVPVFLNYWAGGIWHHNSGKSTLVEAVGAGLWGKLLRGVKWLPTTEALISLQTSQFLVERTRKGRRRNLSWSMVAGETRQYGSESKAQDALCAIVGSFEQWRRSSVFSSSDLDTFTRATDAERKRLLETMIGVDIFDGALQSCRRDLREIRLSSAQLDAKLRETRARLQGLKQQAEATTIVLGPEPIRVDSRLQATKSAEYTDLQHTYSDLVRDEATAQSELAQAERQRNRANAQLAQLSQIESCDKCGQRLSDGARERLGTSAQQIVSDAQRAILAATSASSNATDELRVVSQKVSKLRAELEVLQVQAAEHAQWLKRKEQRDTRQQTVAPGLESLELELLDVEDEIDVVSADILELEAVEHVLGLQGVRAHIVARTLAGVERIANVWIDRLLPGACISLSPDTELKRGGTVERISLDVTGVGHGDGYMGCSGGERRRLDVALLLALAEVQAGAAGDIPGTLFLDEPLDTLDAHGIGAVSTALNDVARERCIVVISHNPILVDSLDATERYHFEQGTVRKL